MVINASDAQLPGGRASRPEDNDNNNDADVGEEAANSDEARRLMRYWYCKHQFTAYLSWGFVLTATTVGFVAEIIGEFVYHQFLTFGYIISLSCMAVIFARLMKLHPDTHLMLMLAFPMVLALPIRMRAGSIKK